MQPNPRNIKLNKNLALDKLAKANRRAMLPSEAGMWFVLKGKKMGYKFRRQEVVGNYILDFYSPELHLAIEVDGDSHDMRGDEDELRDTYLQKMGIKVLHIDAKHLKNISPEMLINLSQLFNIRANQMNRRIL